MSAIAELVLAGSIFSRPTGTEGEWQDAQRH
jgi:hypothetical protein